MTTGPQHFGPQSLDVSLANATVWFNVQSLTEVTITADDEARDASTTAWNTGTLDVLWAHERGGEAREFGSAQNITQAAPAVIGLDVTGVAWVVVRVDTTESNVNLNISAFGKDAQV